MAYLLDTHVLLWFSSGDRLLSEKAKSIIENGENEIYLSSISVWELSIKARLGKLRLKKDLKQFITENIVEYSIIQLPVNIAHALEISKLPDIHKDPFDRMLIAQSLVEDLTIITSDEFISRYDVNTIW